MTSGDISSKVCNVTRMRANSNFFFLVRFFSGKLRHVAGVKNYSIKWAKQWEELVWHIWPYSARQIISGCIPFNHCAKCTAVCVTWHFHFVISVKEYGNCHIVAWKIFSSECEPFTFFFHTQHANKSQAILIWSTKPIFFFAKEKYPVQMWNVKKFTIRRPIFLVIFHCLTIAFTFRVAEADWWSLGVYN